MVLAVASMLACAKNGDGGSIQVDGSSTLFPVSRAIAQEFQKSTQTKVNVAVSGTGKGFEKFCGGQLDIANASRPINEREAEECTKNAITYIELPVAYDGIAILVHPKNDWATTITTEELETIWAPAAQRKIMRWSQVRPGWPDRELHLFGAGVQSGTYDYFTQAVVHQEHSSRMDYTGSEDDDVIVNGVAQDELALGFVGHAYFVKNKSRLKALAVDDGKPDNGAGPIPLSIETIRNNTYQPLSRPVFIYVATRALDRPEVGEFITFYLARGPRVVAHIGYVPLPAGAYSMDLWRVSARRTGSLFHGKGSQVGVSIEQLLHMEAVDKGGT
jgi:phosphate transport system substrate-binding protein